MNAAVHRLSHSPLRAALPRLEPDAAGCLRTLFTAAREREVVHAGETSRWRLAPAAVATGEWVELAGPQHTLWLSVNLDQWLDDIGPRAWWDYTDDARLLAWALAHESLLAHLEPWLGGGLRPIALRDPGTEGISGGVRLAWRGGVDGSKRTAAGDVIVPTALLAGIAADPNWRASKRKGVIPWTNIPAELRMALHTPAFSAAEWRAFEPGDVLLLATAAIAWNAVSLSTAHGTCWRARYRNGRLTLRRAIPQEHLSGRHDMTEGGERTDEPATTPGHERPADDAAEPRGDGPNDPSVAVSFDLGRLDVTLGELSTMQPGYVFELPEPLERAQVIVRANGRAVGRGELVTVGERLGVRLLDVDHDGVR